MKNDIGNYAMHAKYWDWGNLEHDRTAEDAYWYQYAKRYGNRALIPMCALSEAGAYMERFEHSFTLQSYYREEWVAALNECGFKIVHEYRNREAEPWRSGDKFWGIEVRKTAQTVLGSETARK